MLRVLGMAIYIKFQTKRTAENNAIGRAPAHCRGNICFY